MPATRPLVIVSFVALAALSIAWELWLAPLRPGGSLLVLKAVPLLAALPALWLDRIRAYQWWSMLILAYLCEGLVRGASDVGTSATLGWIEAGLATTTFVAIVAHVRGRGAKARTARA